MNVVHWTASIQLLLEELPKLDFGYPLGANELFSPQSEAAVDECLTLANLSEVESLRDFYLCCDGFSLPDIQNGYYLKSIQQLSKHRASDPICVTGAFRGEVHPIGSTGGGGLFVLRRISHDVLYLPPGSIADGIYDGSRARVEVAAPTFAVFLELLLADVSAFVKGTTDHKFIA